MIPALDVKNLKISIRTDDGIARVLDDVGVTLERGRILGVVGESGCGKSTLIRAVMGILPRGATVDAGEIWFEGENLLVFSEKELNERVRSSRIGFIPQDPLLALNPVFQGRHAAARGHALARSRHAARSHRTAGHRCSAACRSPIRPTHSNAIRISSRAASANVC